MKLTRAIQGYLDDCRRRHLSPATLRTYENALGFLVQLVQMRRRDEVGAFTAEIVKEYFDVADDRHNGVRTLLRKRAALSGLARWGLGQRLWLEDPTMAAPRYRKPGRLPRPYERSDREDLMALALPLEERALRAVLYYAGLRAREILDLRIGDVAVSEGEHPGRLRVRGKGDQERVVPMMPALEAELRDYLLAHPAMKESPKVWAASPVFWRSGRRGEVRPWTYTMLRHRVRRWGREAAVEGATGHRFRHSAGSELAASGASIQSVQRFMGHASLDTTMLYVSVADKEVEDAVGLRSRMLEQRAAARPVEP